MPSTSSGFRYPAQSDPVAQGATAIQNLANDIEGKVGVFAAGNVTVTMPVVGTVGSTTVTFPAGRFPVAPTAVFTQNQGITAPQNYSSGSSAISATGFTCSSVRSTGTGVNLTVGWLAVGVS